MRAKPTIINRRQSAAALAAALGLFVLAGAGCRREAAAPPPAAAGGEVKLTATLSTNAIRIGDLLHLRVAAEHPAGCQVQFPALARDKAIVVRDQQQQTQRLPDRRERTTCDYVITSLSTGQYDFVTNRITWKRADGVSGDAHFPFAAFTVRSALTATNEAPRDIHGLARWPARFPFWLLALPAAGALVLLAVWFFFLRPRRTAALAGPPPVPPHIAALAALDALLARGWLEAEQVEPFYVELSAIVRRYLEGRFGLRAPERTTEEFIREAVTAGALTPEHQQLVGAFLEQSDLVKFARFHPGGAAMRAAHDAARRLVQETLPAPSAEGGGAP